MAFEIKNVYFMAVLLLLIQVSFIFIFLLNEISPITSICSDVFFSLWFPFQQMKEKKKSFLALNSFYIYI